MVCSLEMLVKMRFWWFLTGFLVVESGFGVCNKAGLFVKKKRRPRLRWIFVSKIREVQEKAKPCLLFFRTIILL